jgi:TetR/AcrR family transcriptional regulator
VATKTRQPGAGKRKRRTIGRPSSEAQAVGRDALLAKTCELLRILSPEKVTRAAVARYTNVDPSLIRYYFQDRASLLLAAAEKLTAEFSDNLGKALEHSDNSARSLLRARVQTLFDLNMEHPYFHRLLLEEIVPSEEPAAKRMLENFTGRAVAGYEFILSAGAKEGTLRCVNPAFLLLAVIGLTEFYSVGLPLYKVAVRKRVDEKTAAREYRDFVADLVINGLTTQAAREGRHAPGVRSQQ